MGNPFEDYQNTQPVPRESQEVTDERRRGEALAAQQKSIEKSLKEGNDVMAKRVLEAKRRVKKYDF